VVIVADGLEEPGFESFNESRMSSTLSSETTRWGPPPGSNSPSSAESLAAAADGSEDRSLMLVVWRCRRHNLSPSNWFDKRTVAADGPHSRQE
jgi:hypothetical protein